MSLAFQLATAYARLFGGEFGPAGLAEIRYLRRAVESCAVILDVGGGEGKLANELSAAGRTIIVLDREETSLPGSETSIYEGSLARLLRRRKSPKIMPVKGDAGAFPLADRSCEAIVSSQLLEHLDADAKCRFFLEAHRCLRPGGVLAISTPDGGFMATHSFSVSKNARRALSSAAQEKLPRSLRGPWLVNSVQEWETRVGHYDHGCRVGELAQLARQAGLVEAARRATHTRLTCFWLDLTCTFPLVGMLATPIMRALYELESLLPPMNGANLLMQFHKPLDTRPPQA